MGATEARRNDVLDCIQVLEQLDILKGASHASACNALRRPTSNIDAFEQNRPGAGPQQARDDVKESGLSRPVRPYQRRNAPLADLKTCVVNGRQAAETFVDILSYQHGSGTPGAMQDRRSSSYAPYRTVNRVDRNCAVQVCQ